MTERVTFYIDGFNFYYGLKRKKRINSVWKSFYWIDIVKLCSQFLGANQVINKVIYFTASPLDPDKSSRQSALLNANYILHPDTFEVVRGKYINKNIHCPYCNSSITRPEEKKTDVNLSVRMMGDCFENKTDRVVLISADTDLIPPIEFIMIHFPDKKIKVYFPPTNNSYDISTFMKAHKNKVIHLESNIQKFINSRLPDEVSANGKTYTIPEKWKI